ncbi:hypothetical protein Vadar_011355 [Vaccinium darrowii]|uniref:Uncharacterized protein n=1 Tax=Vaccinium darrowii TaxID=229202 RepID=A0ACB7ZBG3_9ERIC|nr:hypothetical protein Vadar_011355 [Vaccinium darrowii]
MLSRIVAEENGLGDSSVDEVEFPQLESLDLSSPSVPIGQARHQYCGAENRGDSGQELNKNGDDPMATSMEKPRTLDYVTDKSKSWQVVETQCWLVALPKGIDRPHKMHLTLGCNGILRQWKWGSNKHNRRGKATASVVSQQWQPASGLAMTGAKLEEAVPCIALSKDDFYVILACGGEISLFNMMTSKMMKTFMPPPLASTFLAFHPQDNNIIAIEMEDSTIHIFDVNEFKLAIYDPSSDRIHQCVTQDVLPAPISFAAYSRDSQLVYTSFCDGNIGVFDADSLTLRCRIATSAYLSPALLSGELD